jgi:hypothetical protein
MKAARSELLAQIILAGDGCMLKDVADASVALLLHGFLLVTFSVPGAGCRVVKTA